MEVSSSIAIPKPPVWADPYFLDSSGIKEPPRGWAQSLKYFGPGLILSASIVGSGELIATTTACFCCSVYPRCFRPAASWAVPRSLSAYSSRSAAIR